MCRSAAPSRSSSLSEQSAVSSDPGAASELVLQLHVLYSSTYSVPVLYFSACTNSGVSVEIEQVYARAPAYISENDARWSMISQGVRRADQCAFVRASQLNLQEHPVVGIPFFFIHPCNTAALMKELCTTAARTSHSHYVISWMSVLCAVLNVNITPLRNAVLCCI